MRAAREYERRCKELQEEREKYRKQLETEMKKTENGIAEGLHHFDGMRGICSTLSAFLRQRDGSV